MGKKIVTSLNSPYTVQFPSDSAVLGDEAFNVDRTSGEAVVNLPAISSLTLSLNQKVVVTNIGNVGTGTIVYPASTDSICGGPNGSGVIIGSGYGEVWRLQPASDNIWSIVNCTASLQFVG